MRPLKSRTFESVVGKLSAGLLKIRDSRVIERVKYSLHDTQMREIFDGAEPESLRRLLPELFEDVRRAVFKRRI